jgi:hypothetical protein
MMKVIAVALMMIFSAVSFVETAEAARGQAGNGRGQSVHGSQGHGGKYIYRNRGRGYNAPGHRGNYAHHGHRNYHHGHYAHRYRPYVYPRYGYARYAYRPNVCLPYGYYAYRPYGCRPYRALGVAAGVVVGSALAAPRY